MWSKNHLTMVLAAISMAGCGGNEAEAPRASPLMSYTRFSQKVSAQPVALEKVPMRVHRYAAQLLEDVRGTESAPTWSEAVLAPEAMPLFRPDVLGVAYYEFRVLVKEEAAGYIIVSTGSHDFPIAHWAFEGETLTAQLAKQAEGKEVAGFYKLDALSYAAEGHDGELLATLGELPPRIEGQDPSWLDEPVKPTDATWVPDIRIGNDEEASKLTGSVKVEGPSEPAPIKLSEWSSWAELKEGYAKSFATLAESLKRQAAEEWEMESRVGELGEGLVVEKPHELALLHPDVKFALRGEGADLVRAELVESAPDQRMLVLTAVDAKPGTELPLTVELEYGNGQQERLRFVVLAAEDVGAEEAKSTAEKSGAGDRVYWSENGPLGAWSPWSTFWAGAHGDQRRYNQISAGVTPNTSKCASGCGGTAWAMLFGWGDYQASKGHPGWAHRFGLYRQNGGTGADAVAPLEMDAGVRNMTWNIRNRIGTFCAGTSGATYPWRMSDAGGYLAGRTGASLSTHYNVLGVHETRLRDTARNSIRDRRVPAIIGTGWLHHYPLAYGYRWRERTVRKCFIVCWNTVETQRQFYVNQGWGGSKNGWVSADTWFAGQLYAN